MTGRLITWIVTTISFLIISRLPIGVEIDSLGKAPRRRTHSSWMDRISCQNYSELWMKTCNQIFYT